MVVFYGVVHEFEFSISYMKIKFVQSDTSLRCFFLAQGSFSSSIIWDFIVQQQRKCHRAFQNSGNIALRRLLNHKNFRSYHLNFSLANFSSYFWYVNGKNTHWRKWLLNKGTRAERWRRKNNQLIWNVKRAHEKIN